MIGKLVKKVLGSRNQRVLSRYQKIVKQANALEDQMQALSDADLSAKTDFLEGKHRTH